MNIFRKIRISINIKRLKEMKETSEMYDRDGHMLNFYRAIGIPTLEKKIRDLGGVC